jgi:(1->4)-alpha-D-glucan 1-alpha-D-glucosylmutase
VVSDEVFVAELAAFVDRLGPRAERLAVAQKLLQLTMPGVPDLYWGTEGWFARLTDPDNRRPPDLARLDLVVDRVLHPTVGVDEVDRLDVDHRKALVVTRALQLRARHAAELVAPGSYEAIEVEGGARDRVLAFCRGVTVTVAEVGGLGVPVVDARVHLPSGTWKIVLGAEEDREVSGTVDVGRLTGHWPGALLERVR